MAFNRFLDQAKQAASKAKDVSLEATQVLKEAGGKLAETSKEKAQETLPKLLEELNGLIPILRECGYSVGDLAFTISIPPKLHAVVSQDGKGSKSLQTMLAEKDGELTPLQVGAIKGLIKAYEFDHTVQKHGYQLGDIELVLSIPPEVTMNLVASGGKPVEISLPESTAPKT
ncbi:MAG: hypothetical protein HC806_08130 [Anaerolineae bacterium]|nr:hypothetical protein [Anaerolineae bacterium]